ncbi:MAG: hypothetical protein Q8R47_01445 [Nanoarchaeota archaeon]|nr:hypothetical protein [Nanoarchaeota archaeon]
MALQLDLVGIFHRDFKGPERLQKLLSILSPDVVSLEYNPKSIIELDQLEKYKQSAEGMAALVAHFCRKENYLPETVRQALPNLYFEYFVSKEYCKYDQKQLLFSDLGDRDLAQQNLQYAFSNSPQTIQQQTEIDYRMANQYQMIDIPAEQVPYLIRRDAYTETILRPLSRKVAHLVGAWHLFGNYHNLYERLRDLNPRRIMLNQADAL